MLIYKNAIAARSVRENLFQMNSVINFTSTGPWIAKKTMEQGANTYNRPRQSALHLTVHALGPLAPK